MKKNINILLDFKIDILLNLILRRNYNKFPIFSYIKNIENFYLIKEYPDLILLNIL